MTSHYPDRCFAFDQFGPLSIRPCHGSTWAKENKPLRLRATYRRTHGIRYFHGCYSLADDQLWGVTRTRKGADHTLAALKSIRAARPGGYRLYFLVAPHLANYGAGNRAWVADYNTARPHSSLGYQTPAAYADQLTAPTGAKLAEALIAAG